ncbi:MAG: hypothetical protein SYNGOMJ08_00499 [Candidatus Syntrophoarchaeum sp. GoM_oil]|nr:MAG: hypothetical protein SYNGOMJ08_00499 [Candidatus Syntrophoarchaeum sp. GoM_oil]
MDKMNKRILGVLFTALMICITAPAIAQLTPFVVSGNVYDSGGNPCDDPVVQVTNLNTLESWSATTSSGSNYYQLLLDSGDVNAGDVLEIEASGCSQSKMVEYIVTESEINFGRFSEDITLEQICLCGDVNCDDCVDMGDVILLLNNVTKPGSYPLSSKWAGDVNCDDKLDMEDVKMLLNYVGAPEEYVLNCCQGGGES